MMTGAQDHEGEDALNDIDAAIYKVAKKVFRAARLVRYLEWGCIGAFAIALVFALHELFTDRHPAIVGILWWIITFGSWAIVAFWARPFTYPGQSPRQRLLCLLPLVGAALVWSFYISDGLDSRTRPLPTLAVLALVGAAVFVRLGWNPKNPSESP